MSEVMQMKGHSRNIDSKTIKLCNILQCFTFSQYSGIHNNFIEFTRKRLT